MHALLNSLQYHADSMFSDWLHFLQPLLIGGVVLVGGMAIGYIIREKNWL